MCLDQIQRLKEDRVQKIATSENTQKRWLDVRKSLQQLIDTLEEAQDKVDMGRVDLAEMQIFLEKERWLEFLYRAFQFYIKLEKETWLKSLLHFSCFMEVLFYFFDLVCFYVS